MGRSLRLRSFVNISMNKLLLLALLGFALIAIAGAEEENQENAKEIEIEEVQNREIRDAGRKKARKARNRNQKQKKKKSAKKSKKNDRKNTKRKSKGKSKKAAKKAGKKSRNTEGKKSKKNRKTKSKRNKKVKSKKSRKAKARKNKSKNSRKNKSTGKGKKGRKSASIRSSSCLNFTCIDTAVSYLKLLKDRVANHEKQNARITRQNKTGTGKSGKKGLFGPVVIRIVENGGGNASNLTCNGADNAGSAQLTNLTETLLKCEDEIKNACDPSNLPQPNMTEVATCEEAIATFKNKTGDCIKKTGSAACTCWDDETIASSAATIKKCDLSSKSKEFAKALKVCTNAFGKCRKYEDDVGSAIHACNIDTSTLTKKLKNLQANSAALSSLQTKLNSTASSRNVRDASDRSLTCSAVISTSTTVVSLVSQNPVSYSIFTLVQTVISLTFTCTETEKKAIQSVTASVSQAIVHVQAEVTHVKEVFASVTGREVTDSEIESASVCTTDDECDSLVEFPSDSATTAAATSTAASAPAPSAPAPTAPTSAAPTTAAAPTTGAPSSAASSPAAPSAASPSPAAPSPTTLSP